MPSDLTVNVGDCVLNLRVGAIIAKGNAVLMVRNPKYPWYYSVGGRIQAGETSEQAVVREVAEELGTRLEIDRLGFIHENYFYDRDKNAGKQVYEVCFYYYMRTGADFDLPQSFPTADGSGEFLEWVPFDTPIQLFPAFFKTELWKPKAGVVHVVTDER